MTPEERDDWYTGDSTDGYEDPREFDRAVYEELMASQGVRIDKHGDPLVWTDRALAIKHTAMMAARVCRLRTPPTTSQ